MNKKARLFRDSLGLVWKSAPGWAAANILISLLQSFLPLALIFLIRLLIDRITETVSAGSGIPEIIGLIIAVVVIYFLDEVSTGAGNYIRRNQSIKLESYMFGLLHSKSVRLDLINFEHPAYYDCLSRATSEAPWRPNSILNNIISMFRGAVSLLLMAGVLFSLHWGLVVLLLAVNVPGIWLRLHFADILYNFQRSRTPDARKSAYFSWLLTGDRPSRELRLFGTGNYFISLFKTAFARQKEEELRIIRKRTLIGILSDTVKALALLLLLVYVAGRATSGNLTLGQMAMFILAFRQGMSYIRDLFGSLAGLYEDSLFIGDTFEFLNLKESIKAAEPQMPASILRTGLEVRDLSFTYPGNTSHTLKNVSFTVGRGEIVALAGPNGAGKSTLVRLITRLYDPDSGVIRYDGTDIRNIDPDAYRKMFSVVFQDFMLYNMSAGENIRIGDLEAADAETRIRKAAAVSHVHDMINNLPAGYDTVIGNLFDDSRELSWGEWQKLALARALFRNAPVLILDEPVSALDSDTEYEIFSRFREVVRGRTTILISHRLTNISFADRIIVVSNGEISETGTHDELMKARGIYHRMYTRQASRFGE
ncbi:MAG TPA: ABC transporter ATP-binding protein [Bacteroidales bacterium]|nr:ABC transporter ATP-binding protein [Bacteroidales bacterium]